MKRLLNFAVIAFVLLAIAGCVKDESTTPLTNGQDSNMLLKKQPVAKTIKFWSTSGTLGYLYSEENECYPEYAQAFIYGEGNATHIGHYTVTNNYCIDGAGNPVTPILGFITAANGDQIFTTIADPSTDIYLGEEGLMYFHYTILGGTGRFDGATGDLLMWGTIYPDSWELEGEGTITY